MISYDTAIVKTGLKMERASKIHDHTDGRYKLGYKLLACAYFMRERENDRGDGKGDERCGA